MKKTLFLAFCAISAAIILSGCRQLESWNRVEAAKISPFLPHPELLVKQEETFPFHYFYRRKEIGKYDNIYVAPVETKYLRQSDSWAKLDQQIAAKLGADIDKLAKYSQTTFKDSFKKIAKQKKLNVIDSLQNAKGKTMRVRLAIVSIVPTKAELNYLGTAADIFVFPGISAITQEAATGTITMECVIEDAQTGAIIAMFADTEKAQSTIINIAGMTWYSSAKRNIDSLADSTVKVFSGEDYSYASRPVVTLIEY